MLPAHERELLNARAEVPQRSARCSMAALRKRLGEFEPAPSTPVRVPASSRPIDAIGAHAVRLPRRTRKHFSIAMRKGVGLLMYSAARETAPASTAAPASRETPSAAARARLPTPARPSRPARPESGVPAFPPCLRSRPPRRAAAPRRWRTASSTRLDCVGSSPTRTSSSAQTRTRAHRRSGWTRLSMKSTWSMQTLRKKRVNSASASSLSAPRARGWRAVPGRDGEGCGGTRPTSG